MTGFDRKKLNLSIGNQQYGGTTLSSIAYAVYDGREMLLSLRMFFFCFITVFRTRRTRIHLQVLPAFQS